MRWIICFLIFLPSIAIAQIPDFKSLSFKMSDNFLTITILPQQKQNLFLYYRVSGGINNIKYLDNNFGIGGDIHGLKLGADFNPISTGFSIRFIYRLKIKYKNMALQIPPKCIMYDV